MSRHTFGGSIADYTVAVGGQVTVNSITGNELLLVPGAQVTFWDAPSAGNQITDLQDMSTMPITSVTTDTNGSIPQFYGPDGTRQLWGDAAGGAGPRRLLIATDIGTDLSTLEGTVAGKTLGSLADVTALSPSDGQVLQFVGSAETWQAVTPPSGTGIRSLLVLYAPPNTINARYDDDYAAGVLSRYDDVVLGAGLEDPGNAYYSSTTAIIQKTSILSASTVVWGYIDCGVTTANLPLSTLQTQIDQWVSIGAKGIFCDVIGYAYHVSRQRQNDIINYIHSKGVGAILNVFNPDEVLSSSVDATYNPSGIQTAATSSDVLLLESWVCNSDTYASPYYATFSDIKTRADKAISYRNSLGIRVFAANILSHHDHTFTQIQSYRDYAEAFARVWRLDGSGIAASGYSAAAADSGLVTPQFSSFKSTPLRPNAPYILNGAWTQVEAPDLGITVTLDSTAGTYTWTQQ